MPDFTTFFINRKFQASKSKLQTIFEIENAKQSLEDPEESTDLNKSSLEIKGLELVCDLELGILNLEFTDG